ncbi:mechanosensitive ion channel family protein [Robiginitalea sediminis]|uniref:mechanosensitive ion channel family protein n=1 Tax=Robiginitalea sediminis TaxID=1982593 RepID=UPI000B4B7B85|nr:mechanosensitive ion channel domain-containing protein [Robiginitalea sediminis]
MKEFERFIQALQGLDSNELLVQLAQFTVWVLFILLMTWLVRKGINRALDDNTTRYRAKKVVRLVSYALILLLALVTFTGKVQYFTLAIGLISAGLAFALQEVILSLAGWVAIFASGLYKPGDRVEINNVKGDVIDIGLTRTTLMEIGEWVHSDNYSGRIVQISNAFVFKGPIRNYSTDFPFVWDEINLPVRYGSDLKRAQELIWDIAQQSLSEYAEYARTQWKVMVQKYLIENANVAPTLSLKLTDNWVEFNLRFVVDYKKRRVTKDSLYRQIHEAIAQTGGAVQLASVTLELVNFPGTQGQSKA